MEGGEVVTTYLGIDPATRCGWAVLSETGERTASGVWKLERRAGDGAGMIFVRFERLFRELLECQRRPAQVAFEQQANRFAGAALIGNGIQASIMRICEEQSLPYTGAAFAAIKKHATGKGNAGKPEMILAAKTRWGFDPTDDNEADACWIADALREGLL